MSAYYDKFNEVTHVKSELCKMRSKVIINSYMVQKLKLFPCAVSVYEKGNLLII